MGFFSGFLAQRERSARAQEFQVLTFAPSVVRMTVSGKDTTKELDALAAAVAKLGFPAGLSTERVFAAASEMARLIKVDGFERVTQRMKTDLSPQARRDAMRLALVAVFNSPVRDSGDFGMLAGMAERIGMSPEEFAMLHESAKALR